ncbi:MAG: class I SAM-dependent methyltransferase [Chloroflexi bacterium]|nr:class I SAM-dependent methyltransferase [Chloroflexota bacterium]
MPYDPIARFYDQDDGRLSEDIPTILGFAQKSGGPVLELGVGSGRLALPLAKAGFEVTGIDISEKMLAFARQRIVEAGLSHRVNLIHNDFVEFELDQSFGLAYCGYNSFLHLIESDEQLAAMECWRRHLMADGLLVIDIHNPQLEHLASADGSLALADSWIDPETGHLIHKLQATEVDLPDQRYIIHRFYDEIMADGVVRRSSVRLETRILQRREMELLLKFSGYAGIQWFGDHDLGPWQPESPRIIVAARPG